MAEQGLYGFSVNDLADYFGLPVEQAKSLVRLQSGTPNQGDYGLVQQWAGQQIAPDPFGQTTRLGDIQSGLQYLGEHPKGSKYHGDFNVNLTDLLANFATLGLYGVGTGIMEGDLGKAAASYGPFGSVAQPTIGTTPTLLAEGAGAGAGVGAAATTPAGVGGFPGAVNAGTTLSGAAIGTPEAGAAGASLFGPAAGALFGLQAANMLGGFLAPQSSPQFAQIPGVPQGGAVNLTPQQVAALQAGGQSEKGPGSIAPPFRNRIYGLQEKPGLSSLDLVKNYYS